MDANFSQFFSNLIKKIKTRKFCVSAVALLLLLTMMASVLAGVNANFKYMAQQNAPYLEEANLAYKSTTAVGYSSSILGTVEREIPTETKNSGLADSDGILNGIGYPVYNRQLSAVRGADDAKKKMRRALITEANYLAAVGTANAKGGAGDYLWMDKNGYLYNGTTTNPIPAMEKDIKGFFNDPTKGNEGDEGVSISSVETTSVHRQLYKHTSSVGLYGGNIADNEPAVIKQITMRYRGYSGYGVTGLYAPAGEVVKVTIPAQYMNATGGLTFHIGQALFNGQANNIWVAKNEMNRMPVILNTLTLNKDRTFYDAETNTYTGYIGSFLGGPVYIRNNSATYTVTISGAVEYNHFILGYTTEEDFKRTSQTSAPYFDLEVQSYGVLHSGPKSNASSYSYSQIYDVAVLWEKVSTATTLGSNNNIGVVFIYDPFVAAGAAVAFPGRMSVNCPSGWMRDALNYNGIINSGSWGNFHEYHHNFQGFGVGDGGEVTNNAMTLASYALYTKISANRGINSYGAAGLSGWNCYTSATWALDQTLRISRPNVSPGDGDKGLALYATLLHNFGVEAFYNARKQASGQSYLGYMNGWQKATHNDMTYFFKYILNAVGEQGNKITEEQLNEFKNTNYPLFVPVSCVYQTGRTYRYDNKYISATTMQPYVINYGENFTLDLRQYTVNGNMYTSGSIVLPDEFEFSVKNTPTCEYGRIVKTNTAGVYTYIPDPNHMNSGKINVTLQLRAKSGAFANDEYFKNRKIEDVHLTLSFDQTHETTKNMLKRTTYTYAPNSAPTSAVTAFNTNYAGYASKVEGNNVNRTQNCNTDIWYTNQEGDEVPLNSAVELKGKIYVGETAKYRISIRGRWNVALFISLDGGKNYKLAGAYTQTNTSSYTFPKDANGKDFQ